jgi:signal transduction histidine kinase
MKKNIFRNYYYICLLIVIVCVIAISMVLVVFSSGMYREEKFKEVSDIADIYVKEIQAEYEKSGKLVNDETKRLSSTFNSGNDITLLIYNKYGQCVLFDDEKYISSVLTNDQRDKLGTGEYLEFNSDKISADKPTICYGSRFFVSTSDSEEIEQFYLMAYGSVEQIDNFVLMLFLISATVILIVFIIAGLILSRCTRRMTKQINNIARITEKYAKGDFSEEIKVTGSKDMRKFASTLNKMADFMKSSDEVSKSFIANVSHELRTPMTTIGGFVDGILDGTIPKAKQGQYLILVSQEIKRLRILVSSMLNMTRFESGTLKPNFTEINLTDTVISTVLMFEKKIEDKQLEIEGLDSDRLMAVADKDLIQQVLYNLIENAIKFVNERGVITFSFNEADKFCYVSIKNTGEGLENDELPQVFDRFYKTDSSRGKDTTGLGLGLSISRKIIHLHNGHIIVKSVKGEYTEFIIKIPVKQ